MTTHIHRYKCPACGWIGNDPVLEQHRKPGINPYESALGMKNGWTEPQAICPICCENGTEILVEEVKE